MGGIREDILIKMQGYGGGYVGTWQLRHDLGISDKWDDPKLQEFMQTIHDLVTDERLGWDENTIKNHKRLREEGNEEMINRQFGQWKVRITSEGTKEAKNLLEAKAKTERGAKRRKAISKTEAQEILERQEGKCAIGGEMFSSALMPQFDHIVPLSQGGGNEIENIQAVCGNCHDNKTRRERRVAR